MGTWLDSYISKMQSELRNSQESILRHLLDRENDIKQMIKTRWKLGKRPNGDLIGFYRDVEYAIFKQTINPSAGGDVDLILSGNLVNSIRLTLQSKGIEIISTDEKFEEISLKYGLDNFNITDDEETILLDSVVAEVIKDIFLKVWG